MGIKKILKFSVLFYHPAESTKESLFVKAWKCLIKNMGWHFKRGSKIVTKGCNLVPLSRVDCAHAGNAFKGGKSILQHKSILIRSGRVQDDRITFSFSFLLHFCHFQALHAYRLNSRFLGIYLFSVGRHQKDALHSLSMRMKRDQISLLHYITCLWSILFGKDWGQAVRWKRAAMDGKAWPGIGWEHWCQCMPYPNPIWRPD